MTENKIKPTMEQTIYCLKAESERYPEVCEECQLYGEVGCDHCYDDVTDVAIKSLKELEQYRAIGTVEDIKSMIRKSDFSQKPSKEELIEELKELSKMKMMLECFEAIGTIEEFKALKEKNEPKELVEHNFQDEVHHYLCPSCGSIVSCNQNYCDECGQALET